MHPFGGVPICPRCEKTVYAAEQIMGPGRMLYHKPCLACTTCSKRLDSLSLMEHNKEPFCKQCYTRNFGTIDLRQANLPHRDDRINTSPIRPTRTGSPARSHGTTSPTQEEIEVEGRFDRAKREQPPRMGSPATKAIANRMDRFKITEQPEDSAEEEPLSSTDNPDQQNINRYSVPLKDTDTCTSPDKEETQDRDGEGQMTEKLGIPRTIPLTAKHTRTFNSGNHATLVDRPVTPPTSKAISHNAPASVPHSHSESPPLSVQRGTSLPASPLRPTMTGTRYGAGLTGGMRPLVPRGTGTGTGIGLGAAFGAGVGTGNGRGGWSSPVRATFGSGTPLCARCSKAVYFAEQVKANGRVFHKMCLRCTDCNTALDSSRLAEKGEKIVCRSCYSKLYGPQGSGYALLGKAGA